MSKDTNPLTGQPFTSGGKQITREKGTGGWRLVVILIIGFGLGFGSAWLWSNRPEGAVDTEDTGTDVVLDTETGTDSTTGSTLPITVDRTATETDTGSTLVTSIGNDEVLVKDQQAGTSVFVTQATLSKDGWVAVQEILPSGDLANILGAKYFKQGTVQGTVSLLRGTTAGKKYAVTLWHDNGDNIFDHTVDALVIDSSGAVVAMEFEAYSVISE